MRTILACLNRNYLIVKVTADNGQVGYGNMTLNGSELGIRALIDRHLSG